MGIGPIWGITSLTPCSSLVSSCLRYSLCLRILKLRVDFANGKPNFCPLRTNEISSAILLLLYFIFILCSKKVGVGVGGVGVGEGEGFSPDISLEAAKFEAA